MTHAANKRIVDEIRLIRARREAVFLHDLEEIDRQYDREISEIRPWRVMSRQAAREVLWALLVMILPLAIALVALTLS